MIAEASAGTASVRIDARRHGKLQLAAEHQRTTIQATLAEAVDQYLDAEPANHEERRDESIIVPERSRENRTPYDPEILDANRDPMKVAGLFAGIGVELGFLAQVTKPHCCAKSTKAPDTF